jgi:hypothetical protein
MSKPLITFYKFKPLITFYKFKYFLVNHFLKVIKITC